MNTINPVDGKVFHAALLHAKQHGKNMEGVDLYSIAEYDNDMCCYLSNDSLSGYVINFNGELLSVFSLVSKRGDTLVKHAIKHGAMKLNCFVDVSDNGIFSGPLWTLYSRNGFKLDTSVNVGGEFPVVNGVSPVAGKAQAVVHMSHNLPSRTVALY